MSPPFVDAIRTAHANANKEFDTFYEYVSKVMTPRRSEHQVQSSNDTIHKVVPQTTKRIRQELDGRHGQKSIPLMTPPVERQPKTKTPYDDSSYMKTPIHGRWRTYSVLDSDQYNIEQDDQGTNVYLHTPHRSVNNKQSSFRYSSTPSRMYYSTPSQKSSCPDSNDLGSSLCLSTTPSVILQDHLQEESRRLDQLHHNVRIVQQQSLALARFHSPSSFTSSDTYHNRPNSYLPRHPPYSTRRRRLQSDKKYTQNVSATPPILPVFTTSTPLGSPATPHQPLGKCQDHPLFAAPSSHQLLPSSSSASVPKDTPTTQLHSRRSSLLPRDTSKMTSSSYRRLTMTDPSSDNNPKAQLSTCNTATMAEGHSNTFRTPIGNKPLSQHATSDSPMSPSITSTTRKNTQQQSSMDEEEEVHWMDAPGNGLEDEHFDRHAKTLDQELRLAKDKFDILQQRQQQQQIKSKTFSLRPSDTPFFIEEEDDATLQRGAIDGDRWTFAGQHYTVHEKTMN